MFVLFSHFYFSLSPLFDLPNGRHKRNKVSFVFPFLGILGCG